MAGFYGTYLRKSKRGKDWQGSMALLFLFLFFLKTGLKKVEKYFSLSPIFTGYLHTLNACSMTDGRRMLCNSLQTSRASFPFSDWLTVWIER
ncbi:hypothetical protein [Flavisolibacter nicotianae]|uniref:hypothetical protein n=1 Tax=Flavisolibacter nicotianae TaxID=2364882 RepID=UPI0013C42A1F|nr:hypothetical protein [Flavisolibacter nicotianae]